VNISKSVVAATGFSAEDKYFTKRLSEKYAANGC